ncbi:MAG TPA: hypothetical protein VMD30_01870 [Tepidisphaeraceae bacterium]|nr:hypothetical protein [Tepidisphaeraceae bacterium]
MYSQKIAGNAASRPLNAKTGITKQASFLHYLILPALIGAGTSLAAAGPTTQPSNAQLAAQNAALEAKLSQLEAKVDKLENQQGQSQRQIDQAIQEDVLKDAQAHSQFLSTMGDNSVEGGYDPSLGFVIHSADGEFSLHPGLIADFRWIANYRQNVPTKYEGEVKQGGNDTQDGFDIGRLRLTFDGTLTHNIGYFVQFQDDQGQGFGLLDAYGTYHWDNSPWTVKAGQFKDPVWHERNLSEAKLLAVDRSIAEDLIGGGQTSRIQGLALLYQQDLLRAQVAIHDGFDSLNTKFYHQGGIGAGSGAGAGVTPTDFGVSGRGEYMLIGNKTPTFDPWTEYNQFSAYGDAQDILVVGAGFDVSQAGNNDVLFHTIDAQYDTASGWDFYGAYLGSYRDLHTNQGVTPGNYYDPGFVVQGGYLVTPKLEPFARYDYTYLAPGSLSTGLNHTIQEMTIGANYYLWNQNVKISLDGSWLPNGSPIDIDSLGVLEDPHNNEFIVRGQFQLAI